MDDQAMAGTLFGDLMDSVPTNSNYLAPWPVFAFDWCKYPVPHGNSAGKIAVGSYLEDPHNFVRPLHFPLSLHPTLTSLIRSKFWTLASPLKR
jgi:WD repeat-containing protein 68